MEEANAVKTSPRYLRAVSRISAWLLLATVAVLVFSGWGITQTDVIYRITFGLMDRGTANAIHRATNIPLAVFFLSHVMANIRGMVNTKKKPVVWTTDILLTLAGTALLVIFILMEKRV